MIPSDPELNRIRWQCRRGMLELDLLLMDFFQNCYPTLDHPAQQDFVTLLNFPDQSLQRWLVGDGVSVAAGMQNIVQTIRARGVDNEEQK